MDLDNFETELKRVFETMAGLLLQKANLPISQTSRFIIWRIKLTITSSGMTIIVTGAGGAAGVNGVNGAYWSFIRACTSTFSTAFSAYAPGYTFWEIVGTSETRRTFLLSSAMTSLRYNQFSTPLPTVFSSGTAVADPISIFWKRRTYRFSHSST